MNWSGLGRIINYGHNRLSFSSQWNITYIQYLEYAYRKPVKLNALGFSLWDGSTKKKGKRRAGFLRLGRRQPDARASRRRFPRWVAPLRCSLPEIDTDNIAVSADEIKRILGLLKKELDCVIMLTQSCYRPCVFSLICLGSVVFLLPRFFRKETRLIVSEIYKGTARDLRGKNEATSPCLSLPPKSRRGASANPRRFSGRASANLPRCFFPANSGKHRFSGFRVIA
jgi:hypothetical protein